MEKKIYVFICTDPEEARHIFSNSHSVEYMNMLKVPYETAVAKIEELESLPTNKQ
jgi:hypothetical protein